MGGSAVSCEAYSQNRSLAQFWKANRSCAMYPRNHPKFPESYLVESETLQRSQAIQREQQLDPLGIYPYAYQ